jgi:hypothetical protein
MSDESSDEYHEDSLPDLVLSSSLVEDGYSPHYLSSSSLLASSAPDLLAIGPEDITDIEAEYFTSGDQVPIIALLST